jgi:hypothetical protein
MGGGCRANGEEGELLYSTGRKGTVDCATSQMSRC